MEIVDARIGMFNEDVIVGVSKGKSVKRFYYDENSFINSTCVKINNVFIDIKTKERYSLIERDNSNRLVEEPFLYVRYVIGYSEKKKVSFEEYLKAYRILKDFNKKEAIKEKEYIKLIKR